MGKTAGIVLIFLGLLLLMKEFRPAFLLWIEPYRHLIKGSFGGITLVATGAYLLTKRALRKIILLLYLIYLILYLVV